MNNINQYNNPYKKMNTKVFKSSNLRKSYTADDIKSIQTENNYNFQLSPQLPPGLQPGLTPPLPQTNNIPYPPGLIPPPQYQPMQPMQTQYTTNPIEYANQLKTNLMETLKSIFNRNMAMIYGTYLMNFIHNRFIIDEYYRQISNIYQANPNHNTLENLMKSFNNPDVLPEYATRLNKHASTMDILIKQANIAGIHNEISILLNNQYNIKCGEYQYLSKLYPHLDNECANLLMYSITFGNVYMTETIVVNIIVDISNAGEIKQLPYGIYDYREYYLMTDGTKYILPECILETFGNSTSSENAIEQIVYNIKRRSYSVLPYCYNNDNFKDKMDKRFKISNSCPEWQQENKNIILDFILDITNNTLGDFYLTNWHNHFTCTSCNISLDNDERCCILKCCNLPYHTACLMKCYVDPEDETHKGIKCNSCGVVKNDIAQKNCSILMGIAG